ncbi:unnamed protein product [Cylicostephanus goldi]|uniref:Uncharacterized protein n=1 Tax=Cylicostephanus goldi TaxID=71465 RepID=A0A3P6TQI7_CYLGO|nr:unnamed protein product [Cylicostephanus goldi]
MQSRFALECVAGCYTICCSSSLWWCNHCFGWRLVLIFTCHTRCNTLAGDLRMSDEDEGYAKRLLFVVTGQNFYNGDNILLPSCA